jgi:hypothetical protein
MTTKQDDGKIHLDPSMVGKAPSTSIYFLGVTPFKVQVKFDIPLF